MLIFLDVVLRLLVEVLYWKVNYFEYFDFVYSFVRDCKICVVKLLKINDFVY